MKTLMSGESWAKVVYFDVTEKWGDPYRMAEDVVLLLDDLRGYLGYPIYVHCGLDSGGHVKASQHWIIETSSDGHSTKSLPPWSDAIDWSIPGLVLIQYINAVEARLSRLKLSGKAGLGIYPDWYGGGGVHLDTRGTEARWGALNKVVGKYPDGKPRVKQVYVTWAEAFAVMSRSSQ